MLNNEMLKKKTETLIEIIDSMDSIEKKIMV